MYKAKDLGCKVDWRLRVQREGGGKVRRKDGEKVRRKDGEGKMGKR